MKIPIETGMTVRTLVDGTTFQEKGSIGVVESKEANHGSAAGSLYWVRTQTRKRSDGLDLFDREPYYADELEVIPSQQ